VNSPPIPICPRRGRPGRPRRRCHLRGQDRWTTTASASASPSPRPGAPCLRRRSDARLDGGAALCPVAAGLDLYPLPPRLSNLYSCWRAYVSDRDSNRAPFRRDTSRRRWGREKEEKKRARRQWPAPSVPRLCPTRTVRDVTDIRIGALGRARAAAAPTTTAPPRVHAGPQLATSETYAPKQATKQNPSNH